LENVLACSRNFTRRLSPREDRISSSPIRSRSASLAPPRLVPIHDFAAAGHDAYADDGRSRVRLASGSHHRCQRQRSCVSSCHAEPRPRPAGFHQRNIVKAISQHTAEAMTSGARCRNSFANAASTAADNIQSCARLIITSSTRRACHTADLPRDSGLLPGTVLLLSSAFISANLPACRKDPPIPNFYIDLVQRPWRRAVKDSAGFCIESAFMTRALETTVLF